MEEKQIPNYVQQISSYETVHPDYREIYAKQLCRTEEGTSVIDILSDPWNTGTYEWHQATFCTYSQIGKQNRIFAVIKKKLVKVNTGRES